MDRYNLGQRVPAGAAGNFPQLLGDAQKQARANIKAARLCDRPLPAMCFGARHSI